jgi:hypothetical protein
VERSVGMALLPPVRWSQPFSPPGPPYLPPPWPVWRPPQLHNVDVTVVVAIIPIIFADNQDSIASSSTAAATVTTGVGDTCSDDQDNQVRVSWNCCN